MSTSTLKIDERNLLTFSKLTLAGMVADLHGELEMCAADRDRYRADAEATQVPDAKPAPEWEAVWDGFIRLTTSLGTSPDYVRVHNYLLACRAKPAPVTDTVLEAFQELYTTWMLSSGMGPVARQKFTNSLDKVHALIESAPPAPDLTKLREAWDRVVDEMRSDVVDSRSTSLMSLGIVINYLCPPIRDLQ